MLPAAAGSLSPTASLRRPDRDAVLVSGAGAGGPGQISLAGPCRTIARDLRGGDKPPAIEIQPEGKKPFRLAPTLGSSVSGLPLF